MLEMLKFVFPGNISFLGITLNLAVLWYVQAKIFKILFCLGFVMATSSRPRATSAEHKVPHRRVEDENIVEELYRFGTKLGQGSFGIVIEATNQDNGTRWAIKKVNKEKAGSSAITLLEREVSILKKVKHDHIICLKEVLETVRKMYLVMELCELGELRTLLFDKGPFNEVSARHIITDLTDAIVYLHKMGIVHRDLKLENVLVAGVTLSVEGNHPLYDIKLTDFGLSVVKGIGSDSMLQSSCGTPVYMAPEVIQNHDYSQQCDMWSTGVILFALLSKEFPFIADKEERLYELVKRGDVDFDKASWMGVSQAAKTLIRRLLDKDPANRITPIELAVNSWTLGNSDDSASNPPNVLEMMKKYAKEQRQGMASDEEETDEFAENDGVDEERKRPDSSGAQSSGSSGTENITRLKKASRPSPASAPGTQSDHLAERPPTITLHHSSLSAARRSSLPSGPRKNFGPPTKIHDNKTNYLAHRQLSPKTSLNKSRTKSARSPVQHKQEHRSATNGKVVQATDQGLQHQHGINFQNRRSDATSGRMPIANRPNTTGLDTQGRATSPANFRPASPSLSPRVSHGALQSATKNRKKN